jgi:hypothetical protein
MNKIIVVIFVIIFLVGCDTKPPLNPEFCVGKKVCYIDDAKLTGRIIYVNDCRYQPYQVQWLIGVSNGLEGNNLLNKKPFEFQWHQEWELKLLEKRELNGY